MLDGVLDGGHLKEVLERVLAATLTEGIKEVPEELDPLLIRLLHGNREEEEEELELEKEGPVKERKKENVPFLVQLYCETPHHQHVILFRSTYVNRVQEKGE